MIVWDIPKVGLRLNKLFLNAVSKKSFDKQMNYGSKTSKSNSAEVFIRDLGPSFHRMLGNSFLIRKPQHKHVLCLLRACLELFQVFGLFGTLSGSKIGIQLLSKPVCKSSTWNWIVSVLKCVIVQGLMRIVMI